MMKADKQIGFIYKDNESIDKILKDGEVVFERGFLREKTSTTLPITFGGIGKNLKDYKVYGNTVQSKLPSGYTQVDYIEGSGTQYIGTNIYFDFSQNFRIVGKVINPDITTRKVVIGTYEANGANDFSIEFGGTSNSKPGYLRNYFQSQNNSSSNIWSDIALPQDTVINYDTFYNASNHKCMNFIKYNDTNISYDGDVINVTGVSTHSLRLFLDYRTSSVIQHNIKIGNTKIYKNDILVGEFIPCYRNSDNEVGLYDLVNDVFYTNQGTGVFTYGSVAPTPDALIEMVSCGDRTKNLLNLTISNQTTNGLTLTVNEDKTITINGTASANTYFKLTDNYIFEPGEYTISGTPSGGANSKYFMFINGASVNDYGNGATNTFTQSTTSYVGIAIRNGQVYDNLIFKPQLELGSTATPYEPYGYKIPVNVNNVITNIYLDEPLRKIDEYSDYIDFINGKVVRKIGEIILDGTTNALSYYGKYGVDNAPLFYINKSDFILPIDYNQIIVASNCYRQFLIQSDRADTMFNYGIRGAISNHRIYLRDDRYKSANDMNNWLSSNNVIVDYVLETPTEENVTLPNIPTIDGNNTLNIETEITPSQVYIKYKSNN